MQRKVKYKSMAGRSMKLAPFPLLLLNVFGFEVMKVIEKHCLSSGIRWCGGKEQPAAVNKWRWWNELADTVLQAKKG
jgi:hypothetical protein